MSITTSTQSSTEKKSTPKKSQHEDITAATFGPGFTGHTYLSVLTYPTPRATPAAWACASEEVDPEVFDPSDADALNQARGICSACPMRETCLDLGVRRREWGVWGGVLLEAGKPREKPRLAGRSISRKSQAATERLRVSA